jgi:hypothetical protein
MGRPSSKRADLAQIQVRPDDPLVSDGSIAALQLEIAIMRGACRNWPFSTTIREEAERLLKTEVTPSTWMGINIICARYMVNASCYGIAPEVAAVRAACEDFSRVIDYCERVQAKHSKDPRIAALFQNLHTLDCLDIDRKFLRRQLEKCAANSSAISKSSGWDTWVRNLAAFCRKRQIPVSGEGPERNPVGSSKFVRLIRYLQSHMPDVWRQHHSGLESQDSEVSEQAEAALAKAVRRALHIDSRKCQETKTTPSIVQT